mmetsp:Transcript_22756/g.43731  ORF Transcript_22756/g.43731 Transcript_22756/m.43731 type:complete len:475 (-) Transcript_22756:159-1583(-)
MSAAEATGLSKSARKRANKKARDAAATEEVEEEAPAPAPKAKPAAKPAAKAAAEPEPKAKAKAKAEPKAEAKAAPEAKAKPAAKPAAKKAAAKPAAKAAPAPVEEEEKKEVLVQPYEIDDGKGGDWECASGLSKKMQRSKERSEQKKVEQAAMKQAAAKAPGGTQYIPGMAPVIDTKLAGAKAAAAPKSANAAVGKAALDSKSEEPKVEKEVVSTVTIKIPEDRVARVIGQKGATINLIKEKCGIKTFDMNETMCTLLGSPQSVALAETAVNEIIAKGYCSLAFDDFAEGIVNCPLIQIPNIIGKGGEIILKIKEALKCEINMPKTDGVDPKSNPNKKVKISIAGGTKEVEECKEVINSIITYGHHEITHPGVVHQEVEIEPWQYSYIIGKGGCEMRHIQKNYKVKVNIPRDNESNVMVVGEQRDCERATAYMYKIIENASQPRGRGAADKAEDTWGDEAPDEDWMSPYIYKRN